MCVVYLAENTLMGRKEVLKVVGGHLINRSGVRERFLGEIRNAAKLHHPNVVTAYSVLRAGESLVLAMEYVEGLELARLVKARGPLPIANACNYLYQAALGLQHAHESGMVHRDIKPGNLMLSRQGGRPLVKVLDFGLAKVIREGPTDGTLTHEGQMLGTPDYIAPEQIVDARRADIRADIYSLGCTLYYLLTAGPPFKGSSLYDILQADHSSDALPLNLARPEVPIELAAVVGKMMAKEPERRFQEPKQVAQALMPFFKKGSPGSVGSKLEVSHASQTNAGRLVSTPSQPATDSEKGNARDEAAAKPTGAETAWESLIDVHTEERSSNPTPAVDGGRWRPRKKWPIALGMSVFGLIVLGGIIIRILDNERREIGKFAVPEGGTVVITDSGNKVESNTPEKGQHDAAGSPVSAPGEARNPPLSEPAATSADPLKPGTSWRGTYAVLNRSWATTSNMADKARPLWLTIKSREGAHFKAVAESFRGSDDVEGNFRDGVIDWKGANESSSCEGNLEGNALVGRFRGVNRDGNWGCFVGGTFSGEFRLTRVDGPPPRVLTARLPPIGPVRGARHQVGVGWSIEDEQLVKQGSGSGQVELGRVDWTDYDLTYKASKSDGAGGFGANFRQGEGKCYILTRSAFRQSSLRSNFAVIQALC
jgi:serine/threonine protein kinase